MRFVIWAPSFSETSGGSIALHLLCHRLNLKGHDALIWPSKRPLIDRSATPGRLWWGIKYELLGAEGKYSTGPFRNPLARRSDIEDSVIIYPEIVSGNPLGGRNIVRWFLHSPGHHTGEIMFGDRELYFFYQDAFNNSEINKDRDNLLRLVWYNDVYRDLGARYRDGSCYIIRKGIDREITHDISNSVLIDRLTHQEKAEQFNTRSIFYSYDTYTMYSTYAAVCGCISVVVPPPGLAISEWYPRSEDRYGIAYGEANIPWAIETRELLLNRIATDKESEDYMLQRFVQKCSDWLESK